jgi:two-component system sensor histidine kinase PhoQ
LNVQVDVARDIRFRGDEGDLMEVLGNLFDNACKWAGGRVRVRIGRGDDGDGAALMVQVDDDGPGIPADKLDAVLGRGVRADAATPGHGIGLAVVRDIVVDVYAGQVAIGASDLGGAAVTVRVPL